MVFKNARETPLVLEGHLEEYSLGWRKVIGGVVELDNSSQA